MEILIKHWASYPRRFPARFPLVSVDYLEGKQEWVRRRFLTCNFSLILRGKGLFLSGGHTWLVEAPCVITQWPDQYVEYGPGPAVGETWDELYLIYRRDLKQAFRRSGLLDLRRPVWSIANFRGVRRCLEDLAQLAGRPSPEHRVDLVDRVCERLILETWLPEEEGGRLAPAVDEVMESLKANPSQEISLARAAAKHGISVPTLRRQWRSAVSLPPARWAAELRLREARRLLVETARPVYEIAQAVGFNDEFYFSRRFRQAAGMPPRQYRKIFGLASRKRSPKVAGPRHAVVEPGKISGTCRAGESDPGLPGGHRRLGDPRFGVLQDCDG